ncbi:MAG: prephenate dehydrogenase/arogenate dehydrogenase family protein [Deltaproteobacteria bacterium]|nr:prephenate dehydrogenase/arogenate dehydrogenase family protein [Deltaproteobacteria bacterium]
MSKPFYEQVAVIGIGMMGTSLALAIKKNGLSENIVGVDRNFDNLKTAKRLQAIDSYTDCLKDAIADAVLVIFATPVLATFEVAKRIVYAVKNDAIITDIGSIKGELVIRMTELFKGHGNYIGSHPITGTEKSGAMNAVEGLFENKRCIITPVEKTDNFTVEAAKRFWESIGSDVVIMNPHEHDRTMAAVSHMPHAIAYTLIKSIMEQEKAGYALFQFAGGGLKDYTRIAASDPVMWRDIFMSNSEEILHAIEGFNKSLGNLTDMIKSKDLKGIHNFLEEVKEVRRSIADK